MKVDGKWRTVKSVYVPNRPDDNRVAVKHEVADVRMADGMLWKDHAHRVSTLHFDDSGLVRKVFKGETAWADAEREYSDRILEFEMGL